MQSDPETDRPVAAIVKLTAPTVGARIDAVLMAEDAVAQESDSEEVASDDQSAPLRLPIASLREGHDRVFLFGRRRT